MFALQNVRSPLLPDHTGNAEVRSGFLLYRRYPFDDRTESRPLRPIVFGISLGHLDQTLSAPPVVDKFRVIQFDQDTKRPTRVEDSALPCLDEAVNRLKRKPDEKLVLVGLSDLAKGLRSGQERQDADDRG